MWFMLEQTEHKNYSHLYFLNDLNEEFCKDPVLDAIYLKGSGVRLIHAYDRNFTRNCVSKFRCDC